MSERLQFWFRVLWILSIVVVIWGTLMTGPDLHRWSSEIWLLAWNDKLLHFGAYLVLSLLAVLGSSRRGTGIRLALSMILLGALLELAQLFVFGRSADVKDEAANTLGSLGGTAWGVFLRFRGKMGLLARLP